MSPYIFWQALLLFFNSAQNAYKLNCTVSIQNAGHHHDSLIVTLPTLKVCLKNIVTVFIWTKNKHIFVFVFCG